MSHNLTLRDGKKPVSIRQTPTWVTDICLSLDPTGAPMGGQEGVRTRYIIWLRGQAQGMAFRSRADLEDFMQDIEDQVALVRAVKDPRFASN